MDLGTEKNRKEQSCVI